MIDRHFWKDKRVLITGHTGFKGSWLALWLKKMGSQVSGYSLDPPFHPNLFTLAGLESRIDSHIADIGDGNRLQDVFRRFEPQIVFHLAAQSLVRRSYVDPIETYRTNVLGTLNVLEAVRHSSTVVAVVNVTTDKCYENSEWYWGYRETDPLGGHDLYSSSKAASEILTQSYRRSFFPTEDYGRSHQVLLATARAGNVIGGGDWSQDRLVPDCIRAVDQGRELAIRSPGAIRPWQHVLEPLSGYLALGQRLFERDQTVADAWNFGPADDEARTVSWVVERVKSSFPSLVVNYDRSPQPHEAKFLRLDCSKARQELKWSPVWDTLSAVDKTCQWYQAHQAGIDMHGFTLKQVEEYEHGQERS